MKTARLLYLSIFTDIQMPQPLPMPDSSDMTSQLVLAGINAEHFVGSSADEFFASKEAQNKAMERFASVVDRSVELSVMTVEAPNREREYHIVNSYIETSANNDDEESN